MSRSGEPGDNRENPDVSYESGTGMVSWLARERTPATEVDLMAMRGAAIDASLPEGVIAIQDGDGLWWRYPLAEYSDYREERRP